MIFKGLSIAKNYLRPEGAFLNFYDLTELRNRIYALFVCGH